MRPRDMTDRLELVLHWYGGMVSAQTGRLVASYDPVSDTESTMGSPIRDIAAVWDMAVVSCCIQRHR